MVFFEGFCIVIYEVSELLEVVFVGYDVLVEWIEIESVLMFVLLVFNGIELGLEVIGVLVFWVMGYIGYGIWVFIVDIGIEFDYFVLINQFFYYLQS